MMIKQVTSAGIIIYRMQPNKAREYLLLKYAAGHWDLPKGKVEAGEALQEAALRELTEETGLDAQLDVSFKESFSYDFIDYDHQKAHKTVIFFVGKVAEPQKVTLSHEHLEYAWLPYEQSLKKLTYKNAQEVVQKAELVLNK